MEEAVGNDSRIHAFRKAPRRGFVEPAQRLLEDMPLYLRLDVDVFVVNGAQALRQSLRTEAYRYLGGLIAEAAAGTADRAATLILSVYEKGKGSS